MSGTSPAVDALRALVGSLVEPPTGPLAPLARAVLGGLDEPLRLAIAGRVKAGKSTLLNALVGEPLAPTDAGECTRVVTWYRHGRTRGAVAELEGGDRIPVALTVTARGPVVDLPVRPDRIRRLEVSWPSTRLASITLVDTPGIGAIDHDASSRAIAALEAVDDPQHRVDAVVFLTNETHPEDWRLLEAFTDDAGVRPDPLCAVGLLSRADEIAGGAADGLATAARLAAELAARPAVARSCHTVLPLAALLGAGVARLTGEQFRLLATVAADPGHGELLASAARFAAGGDGRAQRTLVEQLGIVGVRRAVGALQRDPALSSTALAAALREESGVDRLVALVEQRFVRRRDALRVRAMVRILRGAAASVGDLRTLAELERIEASAHELVELQLVADWQRGALRLRPEAGAELVAVLDEGAADDLDRPALLDAIDRWRRDALHPLAAGAERAAAEVVVRALERRLVALG